MSAQFPSHRSRSRQASSPPLQAKPILRRRTLWRFAHRLQYRALVLTVLCRVWIRTVAELPPFWKHGYGCDCRVGDFRSSHRGRTSSGVVGHANMNYLRACWTGQSVSTATRDQMQSQEITTLISQQISQFRHFARYVEGRWDRSNLVGLSRDDICSNHHQGAGDLVVMERAAVGGVACPPRRAGINFEWRWPQALCARELSPKKASGRVKSACPLLFMV